MPIRLTHVIDEAATEDGARLLTLLLRLMPAGRIEQRVVVIGRWPAGLAVPPEVRVRTLGRRLGVAMAAMLDLQREFRRNPPEAVHAWSAAAAAVSAVAAPSGGALPMVATLSDPAKASRSSRWWRSTSGRAGRLEVVCPSKIVQRTLVESGIPLEATTIIRPGVDFGQIRHARETSIRERLGLPPAGRILLTASPPTRAGGQYYAVWAMALLHQIWPDARMLIAGVSREQRRLRRMVESLYCPHVYLFTEDRLSPAEALAASDVLVVPAIGDISTGWLAWAMAAGVPIVGSAVPAVAEFIADRHNGFLCKPGEPHTLAIRIRTALESGQQLRQCAETARGQAYDVFRAQRCLEEHLKVYDNLVQGQPAAKGVRDTALDT